MRKNDLSVFELEEDGCRLKLQTGGGEQPIFATPVAPQIIAAAPAPAAAPAEPKSVAAAPSAPGKEITSPMVGTFYRGPSPESPAFIDVGQEVNEDTVVC